MLTILPALVGLHAAMLLGFQTLPPLSFAGFQAHMPMSEARNRTASAGGTIACKPTTDPRLRECNGVLPLSKPAPRFNLLISSVRDTAAVIVLTADVSEANVRAWAGELTRDFGTPNHKTDRGSETWQWIRKSQMLRLIQHRSPGKVEVAITLTDGPLLDALGPPPQRPRTPKKQTPD